MKLWINKSRFVQLTAGEGVAGETIGRLRNDVDIQAAKSECCRVNRDIINKLRFAPGAREKRHRAAIEAMRPMLTRGTFPMTTTNTKAKRTEGELTSHLGGTHQTHLLIQDAPPDVRIVIECHGPNHEANADYIRKAWNLHDELVEMCREILSWAMVEDLRVVQHRAHTLLTKAQL